MNETFALLEESWGLGLGKLRYVWEQGILQHSTLSAMCIECWGW